MGEKNYHTFFFFFQIIRDNEGDYKQGHVVTVGGLSFPKKLISWKIINNKNKFRLDAQKYGFQHHNEKSQIEYL